MTLNPLQQELCRNPPADYSDLRAIVLNCTLKPSPQLSHTEGLLRVAEQIMRANDGPGKGEAYIIWPEIQHTLPFGSKCGTHTDA